MANIIKKGKDLEQEYLCCKKQITKKQLCAICFLGIGIISLWFFSYLKVTVFLYALLISIIVAIGTLISVGPVQAEMNILEAGIDGENLANRCIMLLPESYTAFRNLNVFYNGKCSEIDILIVGPTGVFAVETKNLNGSIYGDINNKYWVQHKVGRAGTPYSKNFYSPVKQVNTHVYRVANCLRENGIRAYVNSIVYFSNINASVEILGTDGKTSIFCARNDGANEMLEYILNNNQYLTQEECEKIINLF